MRVPAKDTTFSWKCPYCNQNATITKANYSISIHPVERIDTEIWLGIISEVIICPNSHCEEYEISAYLMRVAYYSYNSDDMSIVDQVILDFWKVRPRGSYIEFPNYIPSPILEDYKEACLIKDISPKASATLARRCLQSMIRDFWEINNKHNLYHEIEAIKEKIPPEIYTAIHSIRSIGNSAAHMEKDINLIIDIDPGEAELLLKLIEILIEDWYISRHKKEKSIREISELAVAKKAKSL